ncbi:hypothetical protein LX36DRAFT_673458 [Colletotrichum falcatum]|nr:hypothetical protein LX36DRAFT_673458 [Colletotrichum falcatum]
MQPFLILSLATATLVSASALPNGLSARAAANTCKSFQIFKSPDTVAGGNSGFVGASTCCCVNAQCSVTDKTDGVTAVGTLNDSLSGSFTITKGGTSAADSLDDGTATYTVGAAGACPSST